MEWKLFFSNDKDSFFGGENKKSDKIKIFLNNSNPNKAFLSESRSGLANVRPASYIFYNVLSVYVDMYRPGPD